MGLEKLKICRKCNAFQPPSEFYKHPETTDGLESQCKTCKSEYVRSRGARKRDAERRYYRKNAKRILEQKKKHLTTEIRREKHRKHRYSNPLKARARAAVRDAIRLGKLQKQPCQICGSEKVQAHHCDYEKPLDIEWMCRSHHMAWHRLFLTEQEQKEQADEQS